MTWTATEVALIITSTATSLAAVGGLIAPFVASQISERRKASDERFESIRQQIQICISLIDDVVTYLSNESIRYAHLENGSTLLEQDAAGRKKFDEFQSALRNVGFLARINHIDSSAFEIAARTILATRLTYKLENGEMVYDAKETRQKLTAITQQIFELVEEGSKIALEIKLRGR